MSSPTLAVAVLGSGPLAGPIADRIDARGDLAVSARITGTQTPPPGTAGIVYVPSFAEIAGNDPAGVVPRLLGAGYDVISTAPQNSHGSRDLLADACRHGAAAFHETGAFQTTIPERLIRSLTEVTQDIRRVELVEELDFTGAGVHPWGGPAAVGLGLADTSVATAAAALVDGYYSAGLHVLDEAVFGSATRRTTTPVDTVEVVTGNAGVVEKVVVHRDLGPALSYRSVWTAATTDRAPLRYRLTTATDTAKGTANVRFKYMAGLHPADHMTCVNAVEAIRPVHERALGAAVADLVEHSPLATAAPRTAGYGLLG